eukprot:7056198-Lingulodinium_polyedra.AAC.1
MHSLAAPAAWAPWCAPRRAYWARRATVVRREPHIRAAACGVPYHASGLLSLANKMRWRRVSATRSATSIP